MPSKMSAIHFGCILRVYSTVAASKQNSGMRLIIIVLGEEPKEGSKEKTAEG